MPPSRSFCLHWAGLCFLADSEGHDLVPPDESAYRAFLAPGSEPPPTDAFRLTHRVCDPPEHRGGLIYESGAHWAVLADGADRLLVERTPRGPLFSVRYCWGSRVVRVECSSVLIRERPWPALWSPIRYPIDQILTTHVLGTGGLIVHAAGFLAHGFAVVLPGVSGAGKTTFSRLTAGRANWQPFSDDRVVIRVPESGGASAHGTPWPGEARIAVDAGGALKGLFFLDQGRRNEVRTLSRREVVSRLAATTSIPWYDPPALDRALEACNRLIARVPARLLTFRPEAAAVDLIDRCLSSPSEMEGPGVRFPDMTPSVDRTHHSPDGRCGSVGHDIKDDGSAS